ncbi:MAG: SLBB domain-containing protein [Pyrinomonadaceae bacterium]|nr:SLBB domain-containing protein [Pyrinomonadaceae bacterium]
MFFAIFVFCLNANAQTINNKELPMIQPESNVSNRIISDAELIQNGDEIDVDVLGSVEYDWRGKPDDNGFLSSLPYSDETFFSLCRTTDEIAAELVKSYSKILKNPVIEVRVIDRSARQPALLTGAIRQQSRLRIQREIKLNELVILLGGLTEKASGEVEILRPANLSCIAHNRIQAETQVFKIKLKDLIAGKPEANPIIKSGDIITIQQAELIYVIGGVVAPQRIFYRNQITLSRALSSVGGFSRDANISEITIYRRAKGSPSRSIIKIDYNDIKKNAAKDVNLEASDIIEVSRSGRVRSNRPPRLDDSDDSVTDINSIPVRVID